jgi:hypothetical protein
MIPSQEKRDSVKPKNQFGKASPGISTHNKLTLSYNKQIYILSINTVNKSLLSRPVILENIFFAVISEQNLF